MDSSQAYFAHSKNEAGRCHPLGDHLEAVAELAREFASVWGADERGRAAGLLHDLGKYRPEFQRYLADIAAGRPPVRAPHSAHGAREAEMQGAVDLAFCITGHHGGLPDRADLRARLASVDLEATAARVREDFPAIRRLADLAVPPSIQRDRLAADLYIRMLFSCLVDADFLDTEAHFSPAKAELRAPRSLRSGELLQRVVAHVRGLPGEGPVNARRGEVFRACVEAGEREPGFFSLTVPTGGGKTLSSLAFALSHAQAHDLRRIIYVIPYLSIIEQNAQVFEQVLGDGWVLQHHSLAAAATGPEDDDEALPPSRRYARLAAENWDAPIIVTTSVQFLESLFANRPSACRKLHNIARSVVVFDECQTLPPGMLEPILSALQELRDRYSVSMVFCTATQPALGRTERLPKGLGDVREIVPDPPALFAALRRTDVSWPAPEERLSWGEVAGRMRDAPDARALCIVNTKKHARELTESLATTLGCELSEAHDSGLFHLSTNMCPAHRLEVLAAIKRHLDPQDPKPCLVASTQLVEAGVDIDFPMVLRALGPLDSIAQAAGRCNREGLLEKGQVVVFVPEEDKAPAGWYRSGRQVTQGLMSSGHLDLNDPGVFLSYFAQLYGGGSLDQRGIQENRGHLAFETVARDFRIIDQATRPVVIRYNEEAEELLGELEKLGRPDRGLMRKLQRYTVNLWESALHEALTNCNVVELLPGVHTWEGERGYDPVFGVQIDETRSLILCDG